MRIARSVLFEVARNFLAALVAMTGAAFFMLCIIFLKRTPGVGLGFLVQVFPLFFPLALQFTVPLALLTGVVMAFSRMAGDGELTAIAAAGVPLGTVARPVLAGAAVVALAAFVLTDLAAPFASAQLRAAQRDLIQKVQTTFRAGLCDLDLGRGRISFEGYGPQGFEDICVEWRLSAERREIWRAQGGTIAVTPDEQVVIELHNARQVEPRRTRGGALAAAVGAAVVERSLSEIVGAGVRRKQTGMNGWELAYVVERRLPPRRGDRVDSTRAAEEWARRSALAASAFFFALMGIPLGISVGRAGRIAGMLVGVAPVLVVYFPILIASSNLARWGKLPAFPALWAGNIVFGLLGGWMLHRAARG